MLSSYFSFSGDLGRKDFAIKFAVAFVGMLLVGVACYTAVLLILVGFNVFDVITNAQYDVLSVVAKAVVIVGVLSPYGWVQSALVARRGRSMGLKPYLSLPFWYGTVLLAFLSKELSNEGLPTSNADAILSGYVAAVFLLLLAWPPRRKRSSPAWGQSAILTGGPLIDGAAASER